MALSGTNKGNNMLLVKSITLGVANTQLKRLLQSGLSAFLLAVMIIQFDPNAANAQQMDMQCKTNTDEATTTGSSSKNVILCDFKFSENVALEELVFKANDQILEGTEFTPYSGLGKTSAFLFLVDTSNPARNATVRRNLDIVKDQMRFSSATRLVGLATFANRMNLIYGPQQTHSNVNQTLDSIVANGAATEFFSSSLEAIKVLKDVNVDRRALVIMSDGKAEDTAYNRADVVSAAAEAGVTVIGLGFAERQSETPALQEIRRLAEETGGHFSSVVSNEPFEDGFLSNLPRYIENGGEITAPLDNSISGDVTLSLTARMANGNLLSASKSVEVDAIVPVDPQSSESKSFIQTLYSPFDSIFSEASQWAAANQALAIILLLLPLILLGLVLLSIFKGRQTGDAPEFSNIESEDLDTVSDTELLSGIEDIDGIEDYDTTRAVMSGNNTNGYFEVVGSENSKYPINGHAVSIGRHSHNDIRLSNDSVHRHHAHLSISTHGEATIHDLDTANGVIVNGEKVDKKKLELGDIVEFGEVRLRFVNN